MTVHHLETDAISLAIDPGFGARVISLLDKRTGREWLVQGVRAAADAGTYDPLVANGWDECFPTVAPADGTGLGWPGMLRDHGDMWGRPWQCSLSQTGHRAVFDHERYSFAREITLEGAALDCRYTVRNTGSDRFGYLYSQHMLLAARPGEHFFQRGLGELLTDDGTGAGPLDQCTDLNPVRPSSAGIATKLYAPAGGSVAAGLGGDEGTLTIGFEAGALSDVGFWGCYGGWSEDTPVHQVAIEPTTAPAHALTARSVKWIAPGQEISWRVRIEIHSNQQEKQNVGR